MRAKPQTKPCYFCNDFYAKFGGRSLMLVLRGIEELADDPVVEIDDRHR